MLLVSDRESYFTGFFFLQLAVFFKSFFDFREKFLFDDFKQSLVFLISGSGVSFFIFFASSFLSVVTFVFFRVKMDSYVGDFVSDSVTITGSFSSSMVTPSMFSSFASFGLSSQLPPLRTPETLACDGFKSPHGVLTFLPFFVHKEVRYWRFGRCWVGTSRRDANSRQACPGLCNFETLRSMPKCQPAAA